MTLFLHLTLANVTGGEDDDRDYRADILEFRDDDGWRKVGAMKRRRDSPVTSVVNYDQMKDKCRP